MHCTVPVIRSDLQKLLGVFVSKDYSGYTAVQNGVALGASFRDLRPASASFSLSLSICTDFKVTAQAARDCSA